MPRPTSLGLVLVALAAACVTDPEVVDDLGGAGGKDDRGGGAGFVEVDPSHSSPAFRSYVGRALALLEADAAPIARLTAASIRAGRVEVDELVDLTCWDFERVRAELSVALTSADYARLHDGRSRAARAVTGELDGYMWSNRVYVSRGLSTRLLAATLVHETNHVINRSEVGYWDDLPTSAFLHEYRAFYAERAFDPDAYAGVDLVAHVLDLYQLDRAGLRPEVLARPLTPRLLPDAAAWAERRVADDPVDDDAACPGNW